MHSILLEGLLDEKSNPLHLTLLNPLLVCTSEYTKFTTSVLRINILKINCGNWIKDYAYLISTLHYKLTVMACKNMLLKMGQMRLWSDKFL